MFFARIKYLKNNTAFRLSSTIAILLVICLGILHIVAAPLMKAQFLKKEAKIVHLKFEQYIAHYKESGVQGLIQYIRLDERELKLLDIMVRISDENNNTIWGTYPTPDTEGAMDGSIRVLTFKHGDWTTKYKSAPFMYKLTSSIIMLPDKDLLVSYQSRMLDNRLAIQIGQSLRRVDNMVGLVSTFFKYSNLIFAIIIFTCSAFLIQMSLKPLREMLAAIHKISAGDMTARVSVRNPKNDIGQVSDMFNHMLNKTETLVIRMKESLDNVAHDLRTPLSRMRLSIEEAVQQKDPNRLREALFDCAEEAEKLTRVLKTLMDISEAEAETLNLYPREISIQALIQDSAKQYDFILEDKHLNLNIHATEDLTIFADTDRLSQALNNLIDNAIGEHRTCGRGYGFNTRSGCNRY